MKRPSTGALPSPKSRKQAPKDDYKSSGRTLKPSTGSTAPKSILKKPLRSDASASKPKASMSGSAILKANTKAAARTDTSAASLGRGNAGGKPKGVVRQAVMASRGDVTGGMGRKRRAPVDTEEEKNSGDDSESDNDGEDEDESDEEEGSDEDDFEGMPATVVKKTSKKHTEENMAEAMSKILGSSLRKADASMPILARSRGVERKLEEEKMEAKARKAITNEKKRLANKDRVKPEYTGMEYEKKLRKVATRGVVQLFNAIKAQQKATDDLTEKIRPITTNSKDKVANLTKASFLDLLKSGTKVTAV
ncbi:hypothetical protein BGZ68_010890 [Mortierella alpina]|nr:hypothetical protein BGZ68_010890 [Mortierella alpina]